MDTDFEELIFDIVKITGLDDDRIKRDFIENNENMNQIKRAFVHKSYDSINNQLLFAKGSIFIKYLLSLIINDKFPNIQSSFQYSSIMTKLQESKNFTQIALNLKLDKYIKINESNYKWIERDYDHICSEVFVSLMYMISEILNNNIYCKKLMISCFSKLNIALDYQNLRSSIACLYELYNDIVVEVYQRPKYFHVRERNRTQDTKYENFTKNKISKEAKMIGFGYDENMKLIIAVAGIYKHEIQEEVARELLRYYESIDIKLEIPDTWDKEINNF
jgi:hypothetical protein